MPRIQCICEICSCGRHRCPHQTGKPIPSRYSKCKLFNREFETTYTTQNAQDRALHFITSYQKSYQDPQQPKPELQKGPRHRLEHNLPMSLSTTYHHDYVSRPNEPAVSFKPQLSYRKPSKPFLAQTIYNSSFPPFSDLASLKRKPYRMEQHREKAEGTIAKDTTMTAAYQAPENFSPRQPYHHESQPLGKGDMNGTSEYQQEFTPKPLEKTQALPRLGNNMPLSTDPFTAVSSNREDYAPYADTEPVKSYKPVQEYIPTQLQEKITTTMKESYRPWSPANTKKPDWTKPREYVAPTVGMGDQTEYMDTFKHHPLAVERAAIVKPAQEIVSLGDSKPLPPQSLYNDTYISYADQKPPSPIMHQNEYQPPRDIASNTTTYQNNYKGQSSDPPIPIIPAGNTVIVTDGNGKGALSSYQATYHTPPLHRTITNLLYTAPPEGIKTWRGEFIPQGELHGHKMFLVKPPLPSIPESKDSPNAEKVQSAPTTGSGSLGDRDASLKLPTAPAMNGQTSSNSEGAIGKRDEQVLLTVNAPTPSTA